MLLSSPICMSLSVREFEIFKNIQINLKAIGFFFWGGLRQKGWVIWGEGLERWIVQLCRLIQLSLNQKNVFFTTTWMCPKGQFGPQPLPTNVYCSVALTFRFGIEREDWKILRLLTGSAKKRGAIIQPGGMPYLHCSHWFHTLS